MLTVTFYTLVGKFARVKTETFETHAAAVNAVKAYAEPSGYTNVQFVDESDDGGRITGRTPGGRGGRNIAMVDYD